jgi:hypothetical protein
MFTFRKTKEEAKETYKYFQSSWLMKDKGNKLEERGDQMN